MTTNRLANPSSRLGGPDSCSDFSTFVNSLCFSSAFFRIECNFNRVEDRPSSGFVLLRSDEDEIVDDADAAPEMNGADAAPEMNGADAAEIGNGTCSTFCSLNSLSRSSAPLAKAANSFSSRLLTVANAQAVLEKFYALNSLSRRSAVLAKATDSFSSR